VRPSLRSIAAEQKDQDRRVATRRTLVAIALDHGVVPNWSPRWWSCITATIDLVETSEPPTCGVSVVGGTFAVSGRQDLNLRPLDPQAPHGPREGWAHAITHYGESPQASETVCG
jgi:hypothetical protein